MPMARPRSCDSQISAMVPAPTACTEAEAPPVKIRKTISIAMLVDTAETMAKMRKRAKEMM